MLVVDPKISWASAPELPDEEEEKKAVEGDQE